MAKKKKTAKVNTPMCIACILFCFTLISIHMTSGLYARYTVSSQGSDEARVAKFDITEDNTTFTEELLISFVPGTIETQITVTNKSETAVNYTITVENTTQNIPLQFQVGTSSAIGDKCSQTYGLPVDSDATYPVKIIWSEEGALEHIGKVDIVRIVVKAVQID